MEAPIFNQLKRKSFFSLLLLLFFSVGCSQKQSQIAGEEIVLPKGQYRFEEVLPGGQFLLSERSDDLNWNVLHYPYVIFNDGQVTPLALPDDPDCLTGTFYERPQMLPSGKLGFVRFCVKSLELPVGQREEFTLVALDLQSGELERIMKEPAYDREPISNFTWNPSMSKGVLGIGGLDATLYWIGPEGPEPMEIMVGEGDQRWLLSDALINFPANIDDENSARIGRATRPAWSPDGQTIAFLASPIAVNRSGPARAGVPFNLYYMSPEELHPQEVLKGIYNFRTVKWSPDGESLLIDGCMGLLRRCGLWIYVPEENEQHLIAPGRKFWGSSWLSDDEIITSHCEDQEELTCTNFLLMRYDISGIK